MNDLINISITRIGGETIQTVNARDLHAFLEVGRDFSNWGQKPHRARRLHRTKRLYNLQTFAKFGERG